MVVERGDKRRAEDLAILVDGCWALRTHPRVFRWRRHLGVWAIGGYKARVLRVATLTDLTWLSDPTRPLPPEIWKQCEDQIADLVATTSGPPWDDGID